MCITEMYLNVVCLPSEGRCQRILRRSDSDRWREVPEDSGAGPMRGPEIPRQERGNTTILMGTIPIGMGDIPFLLEKAPILMGSFRSRREGFLSRWERLPFRWGLSPSLWGGFPSESERSPSRDATRSSASAGLAFRVVTRPSGSQCFPAES